MEEIQANQNFKTVEETLINQFGNSVYNFNTSYNILNFETHKSNNLKVLRFLKEENLFEFLNDLCGVHQPQEKGQELWVVYHLRNIKNRLLICLTVKTSIEEPQIFSATALFSTANWLERETYDFFGIEFLGHPNLQRILNVNEMNYFPLRKEYPLEDQTRLDKDDDMFGR